MKIIRVGIPVPLYNTFDYSVTDWGNSASPLTLGQRVLVPFGKKQVVGIITELDPTPTISIDSLKPIKSVLDAEPVFDAYLFAMIAWAASYYQYPLGDALSVALPAHLREATPIEERMPTIVSLVHSEINRAQTALNRAKKQRQAYEHIQTHHTIPKKTLIAAGFPSSILNSLVDKSLITITQQVPTPFEITTDFLKEERLTLNEAQARAVSMACNNTEAFTPMLLEGVTGSGKTEVYLQIIEEVTLKNKQTLVLVPEIGLTPQTLKRFQARFNCPILTLHSGMNDTERMNVWLAAKYASAPIIIGTRSAIFLPFSNLGAIIVDEEHDLSFKQQDSFRYNARDLAIYRANVLKIPVVLGSATPSFESLKNALAKRYHHVQLQQRISGQTLNYRLIDMKKDVATSGVSSALLHTIKEYLDKKQQVMLFINRRGYSPAIICHECGWLSECQRCSSFYTFHKQSQRLICHHCGSMQALPKQCPSCQSTQLFPVGQGTEQLEEYLRGEIPTADIVRIDRDSTSKKNAFEDALNTIHQSEKTIILGTQMLAKGHHFPRVSLVAILDVDGALYSSDFRASERLAQLITQVSGRAGRGSQKGQILLQTFHPENDLLQDLLLNGYQHFSRLALKERQDAMLPPFAAMALIRAETTQFNIPQTFLGMVKELINQDPASNHLSILGPIPAPLERKAGKFRFQLLIQSEHRSTLQQILVQLIPQVFKLKESRQVRWSIDIDPQDLS